MRPASRPRRHLSHLVEAFGLAGEAGEVTVTGVAVGSADVQPGDLFVALPGLRAHGADYAADAVAAGAVAVLTDDGGAGRLAGLGVPVLTTPAPRSLLGPVSAWFYGEPGRDLTLVGITGTNGKTTTCYFVAAALERRHPLTGVVGTVELRVGEESIESPRTTVEAPVLHGLFALMRERGATACAMEVSSHALALERVGGVQFDVAAFTNLQRDHLDFHGDMEGYFRDKARLFAPERARRAVVCVDDEWGVRLASEVEIPVDTVATREGAAGWAGADWRVTAATIGLDGVGSTFTLEGPGGVRVEAASPLPGLVNVSNAAVAVVVAHRAGIPLDEAVAGVAGAHAIPGRMERVIERGPGQALCLVDYAHTPDALTLALEAVRPITPGRLVLVFGSDGDRDQGKRPIMGEIAARLADVLVVTDENPRSEEPAAIRASILDGVRAVRPDLRDVVELSPRSEALRVGMELAVEGDTVIVTGKGHEPTQEIAGVFHRYNDRDAYLTALAQSWQVTVRPDGVTVVDAAHAATPDSTRAALRRLRRERDERGGTRAVAVLAAPDDLGPVPVTELDALGRAAVRLGVDKLLVVGEDARAVHVGAVQEGSFDGESELVPDRAAAQDWLARHLRPGDVVLVKGGRSAGLAELAGKLAGKLAGELAGEGGAA
ncbi:UDP-N-acetylmuramoyl-L-alanyl-D-glutamate--2,6-diaminopimelate ligase [Actinotalea fermentans]|uniref:UDP-N-acetylmuramyl-tripeptide synthetase n=2 Tax=Actinotalea fermentans TaxID=43671 RepID=A0A511YVM4_9CELL|nr:UDP-N-acetylmuramoyl-L-alanyl-D-glutamate--2,6-diaminopimelate ligase [Actinotalea fermentans]